MLKIKSRKKLLIPVIAIMVLVAMAGSALAYVPRPAMTSFPLTKKSSSYNGYALCVQRILDDHVSFSLSVDGYFGSLTEAEVIDYQSYKNISADGIVGSVTWSKLWNELIIFNSNSTTSADFYITNRPAFGTSCPIWNNNVYSEWDVLHDNGAWQGIN